MALTKKPFFVLSGKGCATKIRSLYLALATHALELPVREVDIMDIVSIRAPKPSCKQRSKLRSY